MTNTREPVGDDTGRYHWCNRCEEDGKDGELSYNCGLVNIPRKESREWQEAHGGIASESV